MFRPFRSSSALPLTLSLGIAAIFPQSPLLAQDPPPPVEATTPSEMVGPLILRDTPIDQILELVERYTGRILLRPSALPPGTYSLTLDKPLPKAEALRALESLLGMNGIFLVPLGERFLKVTQHSNIRYESPEFVEGPLQDLPPSGRVVTKLFTLTYLRAAEFVPQATSLLNQTLVAAPIVFDKNNSILFTDSVATLQRIERLINTLDRPAADGLSIKTYSIVNDKASELVNKLTGILSAPPIAAQIGTATTYKADDRTNQIILIADKREHAFFDELISRLDAEASPNTRSEVIFLKHANATEVADLLSKLITGQNTAASRDGGSAGARNTRRTGNNAAPGAGGNNAAPAAPATPTAAAVVNAAVASEEFSNYLTIVADERSNAIVVAGTPNDIKLITSLVDRIDVLLAQVRIEVVVAEVTLSDGATSGINSLGLRVEDNKLTGFNTSFAGGVISGTGTDSDGNPSGFADILKSPSSSGYNLSGIIGLTTTPRKNNTSILQTPSITTTHNKEAEIFVGETRPVISGTTTSNLNADTSSSTVTQQRIGIRLTVTPLIGSSGDVQLDIKTEVQDVSGTVRIDNNEQPIVSERSTTSYVSARNGDIIVLGGLQRSSQSRTTSRLGPIPFLGDLFGGRSRSKGRTELIFFLRPTVLTNTALDNVEAMRRVDSIPQGKEVRQILETRPASAPGASNIPPPESKKSAKSDQSGSGAQR
jgi:Type II secretory pathway, component PulD